MAAIGEKKANKKNVSTSINETLLGHFDAMIDKLNLTRTEAVEQAIRLWLEREIEKEDGNYFSSAKGELNRDAEVWNKTTSDSGRQTW